MDKSKFDAEYRFRVHESLMKLAYHHLDELFFADTPVRTNSKVDNLDFIEFLMAIEEEFEVEIPEEDEDRLNTLADIADWLGDHLSKEDLEAYDEMCQEREEDDE